MSDSRYYLKGEFEIYGKKFKLDHSLNWSNDTEAERIAEWFQSWRDEAYAEFNADNIERERKAALVAEEHRERALLAELKKKYEPKNSSPDFPKK